jgi:hypothetical protein
MHEEPGPTLSRAHEIIARRRLSAVRSGNMQRPTAPTRGGQPALSSGQRRLWFLDRLGGGGTAYNVPFAFRVTGPLDTRAIARALGHIVDRHEVLRTWYPTGAEGMPYQEIGEPGRSTLQSRDASGESDPAAAARDAVARAANTPFDLVRGPVLRALLIRLGPDDHVLAVVVHHIAFDRESLQIFVSELGRAYDAFRSGRVPDLPALGWQYADFAAWQQTACTPEVLRGQFTYWSQRLADAPPALEIPADHSRPALPSHRAGQVSVAVPPATAAALRVLSRKHGLTVFALTMAAYHAVLSRYTGSPDVVVGCGINSRHRMLSPGLIGFFANSAAIRADTGGDAAFIEFARRVNDAVLDAWDNQDLPFEHLVERLCPHRDLSRYPIIQTWFDCVSARSAADDEVPDLVGAHVTAFPFDPVHCRFDLETHLVQDADGELSGRVIYAADLFERDTMARFAGHYVNFLQIAAAQPGQRLSRIDMLGDAERHRIIEQWGVPDDAR